MSRETMYATENDAAEELNLLDYWLLIRKHLKQIFGLAFVVTLLAILVAFQMTPIYRSTAMLLIENSKSKALTLSDLYDIQGSAGQEAFNSQVQILKSRPIAEIVIKKLDMLKNEAFTQVKKPGFFSSEPEGTPAELAALEMDAALERFSESLTIEPILKSQIVKVSFDSSDKELAAKVANAVAEAYIENDLESRSQMTQRANAWLTERMDGLRKQLEESEKVLQAYRERENIIDSKGVAMSGTAKQLEEISTNLIVMRQRLAEAEGVYVQVKDQRGQPIEVLESIPAVLKSPSVQQMKEAESTAQRKLNELQSRYTAAHPKVIAAESELKSARDTLKREIDAVISGITKEYDLAKTNVIATSRALDQIKSDIQNLTRKEFQLSVLQREAESNKQLYDLFVNRAKETDVASNLQSTAGRIVDPAVVESIPLKPKKKMIIGIAFILGLLAGIAIVFVLDYLDNTMHSVPDVERRLGVDVLGTVQVLDKAQLGEKPAARAFLSDPNSLFSESIRTVRTAVLLSAIDEPHRVVMVTSTVPSEGKTTISINLAFALGQMKKVLLVDGDMRRPSLAKSLGGLDDVHGLVDYLADDATLEECIQPTDSPNVFVLTAGKHLSSPLELLSSHRFGETIAKVKDMFDMVIIDCPPLKPVSDSLVISRYANALLYVVKADSTPHQLVSAAMRRLHDIQAPVLGVVLNQLDNNRTDRYGHYSYQYEYVYGQDMPTPSKKSFLGIKI
ncbi:MAG: polysaccharide biosynthesis tyrosine autokinase [Sideroxydans sp.]|nr:polysaccharide biosynthesis tyrosine autokinase [Sideroxydans sp.]